MRSFSVRTAPTITVCAASPNPVSCSTSPRACKPISPPCRRSVLCCVLCWWCVWWVLGSFSCGRASAPRPRRVARASRASRSTTISPSRSTPCWANNTPCRSADARGAASRRRRRRDVARFCVALCAVHIGHGDLHPALRPAQRAHLSVSLSLALRLHHAVDPFQSLVARPYLPSPLRGGRARTFARGSGHRAREASIGLRDPGLSTLLFAAGVAVFACFLVGVVLRLGSCDAGAHRH